jgi:hypothetical protein
MKLGLADLRYLVDGPEIGGDDLTEGDLVFGPTKFEVEVIEVGGTKSYLDPGGNFRAKSRSASETNLVPGEGLIVSLDRNSGKSQSRSHDRVSY